VRPLPEACIDSKLLSCLLLTLCLLFLSSHRLPAPIQEIPDSPTPAKPKRAHQEATQRKIHNGSAEMVKKAPESKNNTGPATVFIYRPAGFPWGMYNSAAITIDGVETRTMADARYSVRKLNPGRHFFEAKGGVITNQRVPVEIDLKPGQNYYLRVSIDAMGFPEGKIIFTSVPNAEGAADIAKLKPGP
jgi:hypothetical protein